MPAGGQVIDVPGVGTANSERRCIFALGVDTPIEALRGFYRSTLSDLGSDVRRLTSTGINLVSDWSPDGRQTVFSGGDDGNEIHIMNADGTGQRLLRDMAGSPVWSPNGREIAVGTVVMDADGSNVRQLAIPPGGRRVRVSDWSHP